MYDYVTFNFLRGALIPALTQVHSDEPTFIASPNLVFYSTGLRDYEDYNLDRVLLEQSNEGLIASITVLRNNILCTYNYFIHYMRAVSRDTKLNLLTYLLIESCLTSFHC